MATKQFIARFDIGTKGSMDDFLKRLDDLSKAQKVGYTILGGVGNGADGGHTPNKELEILMNLSEKSALEIPGYAPKEFTQTGIANNVDLDTSVISRYLKNLRKRGLVSDETMNIIGDSRRRKVYFITKNGTDLLNKLFKAK